MAGKSGAVTARPTALAAKSIMRLVKRTSGVTLASSFTRVHGTVQGRSIVVRLSIPAQLAFRDLALQAVFTAIEAEADPPLSQARDEIVSAMNEAFNNIVLHAYRGILGGRVDLAVSARRGEVEIELCDRGRSFDPDAVPDYVAPDDLDIAALPENGMGLYIMRSFMDEVAYTRGAHGKPNVLVLRKRWTPEGLPHEVPPGLAAAKKESSQSGWRLRSVAFSSQDIDRSSAGSLKRK
ncbi:MAG: ATP-binding protein [Polyangiaceae bacterium]